MDEGDLDGVEGGAFEAAEGGSRLPAAAAGSAGAVHHVAGYGIANVGQMDAGLVGAAGVQADPDVGAEWKFFQGPGIGLRLPRVPSPAAVALPVLRIAPDGLGDPLVFAEPAHHQCLVLLFYLPLCESLGEAEPGRFGAGGNQHSARTSIKAMDQPRTARRADSGDLRVPVDQPVCESSRPVAGPRMHHQPRRFIDDYQPAIFVQNLERHGFR